MASDDANQLAAPWGTHELSGDEDPWTHRLGPLALWARSRSDELWVASSPGDWYRERDEGPSPPPLDDEEWNRWPVEERPTSLRLDPLFPSRSLVLKPEHSFRLLPGSGARIFVRVPLWAQLSLPDRTERTLAELPTVALSDTWWGEFTEGELCYWLPTTARREVKAGVVREHQAVCPLDLTNRSDEELEVERIALRVEHLSVYLGEYGFWSDVTRVRYKGGAEGSQIEITGRAPREAGESRRVALARTPITKSFHARTFSKLRALSGLGGDVV